MENYHVLDLIGEGSFGKVYKGRKKFTGQVVALKFIAKTGRSDKDLKNLKREIEIMRELHHPNIVEMLDSFETENEVVAVTDFAEGELFQILEDDGSLPEEQVRSIAGQLVSALYYLHSHRILHRDMKPQNVLLGKGGLVKLCDFGFARAMSINTLVLTSIKGTPLYMSPELVEEKPYDHTADLWALGCILYELFTGTPPFYTNSIFQLVSLIIKDPVKWPKNMSPAFKDFLQGLLTKNARARLQWPELLNHHFITDLVKVSAADKCLQSPFTQPLTASMVFAKEQQTKAKAHPPGASKILNRARKKAAEEEKKKNQQTKQKEAWSKDKKPASTTSNPPESSRQAQAERPPTPPEWSKTEEQTPTPRPDRIEKDYEKEYPEVEVQSRKEMNVKKKAQPQKIENVNLEEADSGDEWQSYVELTDPSADPEPSLALLEDKEFVKKLSLRLNRVKTQTMQCSLDGAAKLRAVLRVITNLVTLKCDVKTLVNFLTSLKLPEMPLDVLREILDSEKVKKEPWCQQIILDLVVTVNAYFASEIIWNESSSQKYLNQYMDYAVQFMTLSPKLFNQKMDEDLKLQEQVILCIIYLCETMERSQHNVADAYFSSVASKCGSTLEVLLKATPLDKQARVRIEELTRNKEIAEQRVLEMNSLAVAALAALTNFPHETDNGIKGKRKVAHFLGQLLCDKRYNAVTSELCQLVIREDTSSNALKVVYAACQMSNEFCMKFTADQTNTSNLINILQGKIDLADMELNTIVETVLHIISTILVQMQECPATLASQTDILVAFFMDSQIASHTAASALLFSQLIHCANTAIQVQPEDMLMGALSCFTDLTQILTRCPFDYGIFDGVLLLMCQLLMKAEGDTAKAFIDLGVWGILWHRLIQMLQVRNPGSNQPIYDMENEEEIQSAIPTPDFGLLSPQGLIASLQLATSVFTKESFQCVPSLGKKESVISLTLMHLIDAQFLEQLATSPVSGSGGRQLAGDVLLECCQILCFPYAVDINAQLLDEINNCLYYHKCVRKLMESSMKFLDTDQLDLVMGLVARLVLGQFAFVEQFVTIIKELKASAFLRKAMLTSKSPSMLCDLVSVCSHLARSSPDYLDTLIELFKGDKGDYQPLRFCIKHHSCVIRSRACNLLGNMMKFDDRLYVVIIKQNLNELIVNCLKDEDPNVVKGACYAVGNAAFHNEKLYATFKSSLPTLVALLRSNNSKIRGHSAGALGNLALHNDSLVQELIKEKVAENLLDTACHDGQYSVQESALTSLRVLVNHADIKLSLQNLEAGEKLTSFCKEMEALPASAQSGPPRGVRTTVGVIKHHCDRLIQTLTPETGDSLT